MLFYRTPYQSVTVIWTYTQLDPYIYMASLLSSLFGEDEIENILCLMHIVVVA